MIRSTNVRIVKDPLRDELVPYRSYIAHEPDVPILTAAIQAEVNFLVTLNRRHFIDDPTVAQRSGLRIGTPGDALAWLRAQLASD